MSIPSAEYPPSPNRVLEPASASATDSENPWLGLASYSEAESSLFHGRAVDTDELFRMIKRGSLTVFFGQSGLGKTSLLRAGLFPRLRENGFLPVYLRLDFSESGPDPTTQIKEAIQAEALRQEVEAPVPREADHLWSYFHRIETEFWDSRNRLLSVVLVLDQFEEIFTLGWAGGGPSARVANLIEELAALAENRPSADLKQTLENNPDLIRSYDYERLNYKIIISLREDYLPHLEGFRRRLPSLMFNRLRLTRMNGARALEAVLTPGRDLIDASTARKVVYFVAGRSEDSAPDGPTDELSGLEIEPALLSVVCRELNLKRRQSGLECITASLLTGAQEEILADFYRRCVADVPPTVRAFLEDRLLTRSGHRDSVAHEEALAIEGVTPTLVETLISRRLLRQEERFGVNRLELTHDLLTSVIRASRDRRREESARREEERKALEARQLAEELRRKLRRTRSDIAVFAVLTVFLVLVLGWAIRAEHQAQTAKTQSETAKNEALRQRENAQAALNQATASMADLQAREGDRALAAHDYHRALTYYRYSLELMDNQAARLGAAQTLQGFRPEIGIWLAHDDSIQSIAYSHDGRLLASGSKDNTTKLWEVRSGREVAVLNGHGDLITCVAFSPDDRLLATGSKDNSIRVWEVASGREVCQYTGHQDRVNSLAFSPDGSLLVSGSWDKTIKVWDVASGQERASLSEHQDRVNCVAFSPDGRLLASGSRDETVRLWEMPAGRELRILTSGRARVAALAFSPDGRALALGCMDKTIRLLDIPFGRERLLLLGHQDGVVAVAFGPEGRVLASGSGDKTVRLWDLESGKELATLSGHQDRVAAVAFSPDGRILASGAWDNTVRFWAVASTREAPSMNRHQDRVSAVAYSPDGQILASASWDKTVRLWEPVSGRELAVLAGHQDWVTSLAFSPDGRTLATGSKDESIRLWDPVSGKDQGMLKDLNKGVGVVAYSPDGRILASGNGDNNVHLWETATGRQSAVLSGHRDRVLALAFSPDGRALASGSWDNTICLWEMPSGRKKVVLPGHEDRLTSLAFSPDGRALASGSRDETIRLWDASSGRELRIWTGIGSIVSALAFSPDGQILASGCRDETVRIWDLNTDKKTVWPAHGSVASLTFRPDGRALTAAVDKTIRSWPIRTGPLVQFLAEIKTCQELGSSITIGVDHNSAPRGALPLTQARLAAAEGRHIPWFSDQGTGWTDFYWNSLTGVWVLPAGRGANLGVLKALISKGLIAPREPSGHRALRRAAAEGLVDCVALLLENGADPDNRDWNGNTALMYAAEAGRIGTVQLLIEKKADLAAKNRKGQTAANLACGKNSEPVYRLLTGESIRGCKNGHME